jgi:low affinity Fe/Cu permease
MCEKDGVWVPELDELLNNFDEMRNDFIELKKFNSELKELIIELIQKKNVANNNKPNEKVSLHRKHKRHAHGVHQHTSARESHK